MLPAEPFAPPDQLSRRLFLADLGRGALAVAVLGAAGCVPGNSSGASGPEGGSGSGTAGAGATGSIPPAGGASSSGVVAWTRVNLGFVSAYVLVRGGEAAIVDTGVAGSEDRIASALSSVGLGWDDVGHVILTHKHADHAGSIAAVLAAAPAATGYIGSADRAAVQSPRDLTVVNDGDVVFGLRIVGTPGHTMGHVSVHDAAAGLLVAGDALRTVDGPLAGSNPSFTEDMAAAKASIVKLGALTFETLLVGHGEPILTGASARVAELGRG